MRSVVVVLPASIWAMIPMFLRTSSDFFLLIFSFSHWVVLAGGAVVGAAPGITTYGRAGKFPGWPDEWSYQR
jgi:hypothetical protein